MIQNGTAMRSLVYTDDEMKKKDEVGSEHVEYESEYEDWDGNIHTSWHRMRY